MTEFQQEEDLPPGWAVYPIEIAVYAEACDAWEVHAAGGGLLPGAFGSREEAVAEAWGWFGVPRVKWEALTQAQEWGDKAWKLLARTAGEISSAIYIGRPPWEKLNND